MRRKDCSVTTSCCSQKGKVHDCGQRAALPTSIKIDLGIQIESPLSDFKATALDSEGVSFRRIDRFAKGTFPNVAAIPNVNEELQNLAKAHVEAVTKITKAHGDDIEPSSWTRSKRSGIRCSSARGKGHTRSG